MTKRRRNLAKQEGQHQGPQLDIIVAGVIDLAHYLPFDIIDITERGQGQEIVTIAEAAAKIEMIITQIILLITVDIMVHGSGKEREIIILDSRGEAGVGVGAEVGQGGHHQVILGRLNIERKDIHPKK